MSRLGFGRRLWGGAVSGMLMGLILASSSSADERPVPPNRDRSLHLEQKNLPQLRDMLDRGEVTSEQLTRFYLARIGALDDRGPAINAMLDLAPGAIARARELDRRRDESGHGPLYGIPFVVKDNIDVMGLPTSGGSMVLSHAYPEDSAHVVQQLEQAGAILLGKTNMTEFAASYGDTGYSSRGGITRNPWRLDRSVLGSSSGSAAAVAAGFAPFAIGTDTEGSVRGPAHATGLVAMRPTLGRVSRDGIIPLAMSFDTPAPMTRTVQGNAWVLAAMTGRDDADEATWFNDRAPLEGLESLPAPASSTPFEGLRVGVIEHREAGNQQIEAHFGQALQRLEALGATPVKTTLASHYLDLWPGAVGPVHEAEFQPQLERYLRQFDEGQPHTLKEILERCESLNQYAGDDPPVTPRRIRGMQYRLDKRLEGSPEYLEVISRRIPELREHLTQFMADNELDALVFPTEACPAPPLESSEREDYECTAGEPFALGYIASATGFPELTLPMGMTKAGVPINVSLLGGERQEAALYRLGLAFMQDIADDETLALPAMAPLTLPGQNAATFDRRSP
ncbi:amidase [Kushneria indalinina]|uniref:Amidase n=1 Tax=Kushneria indalinina DSM 14324 TaxID=1122140 RepID=A0A3D9DV08_9GAMM|nr:amidase family protein [Kushneria indalinina]REC94618.1 amidase [Kushneria indalinina DSM 14324]